MARTGTGFLRRSNIVRRGRHVTTLRPATLAATLMLAGCAGPLSTLDPEGPSARGAATLWWIMLTGGAAIFAAVSIVLALAWWKPRPLRDLGPGRVILWGGVVVPALILSALVGAALALGERLLATPQEPTPLRIEASASRWMWEFRYPDTSEAVTEDRLHIPAGRDIDFVVTSEDVIHSFWIPRLGGKIDAVPGHENVVRLRADRPGAYGGVCAEYCGEGHMTMRFTVEAHAPEEFEALLAEAAGRAR
jgi:cytochrome c oxidase subunit 2